MLGGGESGLFKIGCGDDDNGTQIDAYFIPVTTDFGELDLKRIHFINFSGNCDGNLYYEITGDNESTYGPYYAIVNSSKGRQRIRTKTGRGLKFYYANIKVGNVDGSDFSVNKLQIVASF
jgi:hypothetical protein